jgi:hypothetical protein
MAKGDDDEESERREERSEEKRDHIVDFSHGAIYGKGGGQQMRWRCVPEPSFLDGCPARMFCLGFCLVFCRICRIVASGCK